MTEEMGRDPFETTPDKESMILTGIIQDPTELIHCVALDPECFESMDNTFIFKAIKTISDKGERVNSTSVMQELTAQGLHDVAVVVKQMSANQKPASIETAVRVLIEDYGKRRLRQGVEELINSDMSLVDMANKLQILQQQVSVGDNENVIRTGDDFLKEAAALRLERNSVDTKSEIHFGYPRLESNLPLTKGAGVYTIIAARPHVGKTAFALSLALNIADAGTKVAFISLEMGESAIADRLLTMKKGVATTRMHRYNALTPADVTKIEKVANGEFDSSLSNLVLCYPNAQDIGSIERLCWKLKTDGVEVIFIDQLSNIRNSERGADNDTARFAMNSRRIQELKKKLKIPVFLLAQLNRGTEQRVNGAPEMSDMKQSGALEEDADCCILLHSRAVDSAGSNDDPNAQVTDGMLTVSLVKNRVGGRMSRDDYYRFNRETATVIEGPYGVLPGDEVNKFSDMSNAFDSSNPNKGEAKPELRTAKMAKF